MVAGPEKFSNLVTYLTGLHQTKVGSAFTEVPKAGNPATLESFFDDGIQLREPVWFGAVPGREKAYVVLEHCGRAWIIEKTTTGDVRLPFLDFSKVVHVGGATGLLSMAFHPKFPEIFDISSSIKSAGRGKFPRSSWSTGSRRISRVTPASHRAKS